MAYLFTLVLLMKSVINSMVIFQLTIYQLIRQYKSCNMKIPTKNETRQHYSVTESLAVKPSYENLEEELINLYPKVDLLNSQLNELKSTMASLCDSCDIKDEHSKKIAFDEFNEKIKLKNLTRLSVIALETAQIVAALRLDNEKAALLEHAVASVKIVNDYTQHSE